SLFEDPQYLTAEDQSCEDISSRGSRAGKEKVELIEDDLDHNFSDILNEESMITEFQPPQRGNLDPWEGGHGLSSNNEIPIDTSNTSHHPRQHQQKAAAAAAAAAVTLGLLQSATGGLQHQHEGLYLQGDEIIPREYVCSFCERSFSHRTNLQAHERIHTGEKPFHCLYCSYQTALKGNLKMHTISRHKIDWKSIKHLVKPQPSVDMHNHQQQQQQQELVLSGSLINSMSEDGSLGQGLQENENEILVSKGEKQ
ncbi:unnamed protein product, partial [Meganyctiphanes norvegica]